MSLQPKAVESQRFLDRAGVSMVRGVRRVRSFLCPRNGGSLAPSSLWSNTQMETTRRLDHDQQTSNS
jgi:hypothetical protein